MGRSWRSLTTIASLFCAIALTQFGLKNTSAQAADTVVVRLGLLLICKLQPQRENFLKVWTLTPKIYHNHNVASSWAH